MIHSLMLKKYYSIQGMNDKNDGNQYKIIWLYQLS